YYAYYFLFINAAACGRSVDLHGKSIVFLIHSLYFSITWIIWKQNFANEGKANILAKEAWK
ncbi:MAG: hypothetical protein K2P59_02110, partial [Acetatifactor sp.]|nr:hypothetical protein [Acetatifactor sp.]